MGKYYKIGILGLGSIGTRHLYNVINVLQEKGDSFTIDLIRSSASKTIDEKVAQYINETYYSFRDVPDDYDVVFITNPTFLHFEAIKQFVSKTKHMFIEKPVFDKVDIDLEVLNLKEDSIYYVACPLRYSNVIQYIKQFCDIKKIYCARVICSSYLPDWRPNQDYRETYSAHADEGGGVSIDLIHEWDYLHYLFGQPEQIYNIRGKFSNLEIDSDDLSLYIARYQRMAVEVHLDYFGRRNIREIQLFTDEETIIGDLVNSEIHFLKSGRKLVLKESRNDFQLKEIIHFFNILEGKKTNHNDIPTAMKTLKIAKEGRL
jgi:predicted dehydrogenase